MYRLMGLAHARARTARSGRCAREAGQGTVEYVALILLVALVMAGRGGGDEGLPLRRRQGAGRRDPRQDQGGGEQGEVLRARAASRAGVAPPPAVRPCLR